jgi:signal transduction histidine kinase
VLVFILVAATACPILALYLLSASGLIEATYVTESSAGLPRISQETEISLDDITPRDVEPGERIPFLSFSSETGRLITTIPADRQRILFTSPVFKLRVDLPAWLVLGSLPLLGLLFGLILSVSMSRSVTRPIYRLAEAVKAIGHRDLSVRVPSQGSQEIMDLANSFNRMADELEHAEMTRRNLMADVAHELRTPLTVIDGNLRALLDGVHTPSEEEIALLFEQTHHLKRLVADLGELSLAESDQLPLKRRKVDLAYLVNETVAHFDLPAQEAAIALRINLDQPLIHPSLDKDRIRQVLHNLLSNAFKHTPKGGEITVSATHKAADDAIEIAIADTGSGIAKENLPHIFNRFYRDEDSTASGMGGTGLGLAIAKAIVEAHEGTIFAESEGYGRGSAFRISLPLQG